MRYEVDVEEYGTVALEARSGGNVLLTFRWDDGDSDMTFDFSAREFKQLQKAMTFIQIEMEEKA